jgi:hypothetical protein
MPNNALFLGFPGWERQLSVMLSDVILQRGISLGH